MRDDVHVARSQEAIETVVTDNATRFVSGEDERSPRLYRFPHRPLRRPRFTMPRIFRRGR